MNDMGEVEKNVDSNKIDLDDLKCELIISAFQLVSDLMMKFVMNHKDEINQMIGDVKVLDLRERLKRGSGNE
jgi:hypothetical protein